MGGMSQAAERGQRAAFLAGSERRGGDGASNREATTDAPPVWASRLRSEQNSRHRQHLALAAIREGDRGGAGASPDISEKES